MACFGETKDTTEMKQSTTQQTTATAEEQELNRRRTEQAKQLIPYETAAAKQGYGISSGLLSGGKDLPAEFNKLFAGISPEITADIAQQSIQDLMPGFQKSGILDSGVAASIAARTAGDVRRQSAEYNLTNLFNLLQTGLGYGGQQQQLTQSGTGSISNTLAGLRNVTSTGSGTSVLTTNPFLKSFYTTFGNELGSPSSVYQRMGSGSSGFATAGASSREFKNNIQPSTVDSIETLKQCDVVEFNYKPEYGNSKTKMVGLIAEDVPEVLVGEDGKSINMYNAVGLLIDSNKKLIDRIEKLESDSNAE